MSNLLEREVPLGAHTYRVGRVSVLDQMHLAAEFRDAIRGMAILKQKRPPKMGDAAFRKTIEFLLTGGGAVIAPEVFDRVMMRCLHVTLRKDGDAWAPVLNASGGLMYSDIELPELSAIMYEMIDHNGLLDFFSESPSSSGTQVEKTGPHSKTGKTGNSPR